MCLRPKWIYKRGNYKENNYRGSQGDFYEIGTYSKCGACEQCIAEKANNWVIRNYYEQKAHQKKCFLTLTYAETPYFLVRKDLTDFIKRFRNIINEDYYKRQKIAKKQLNEEDYKKWKAENEKNFIKTRLFYAGEYGTAKGRPHYHVIIYGWEDENAEYLGINKKTSILYQSKIIQKAWGLGRTSYQKYNDHEIPYIALYNTAKENFKKAYKMTREKAKQIRKAVFSNSAMKERQRINLLKELNEIETAMEEEKLKYYMIKEFNGWSIALGWEQFEKQYIQMPIYDFTEYVEGCAYVTPTPWVKKLANQGDIAAAEEMFRREEEIRQSQSEEEERERNENKLKNKRKKEQLNWHQGGRKNGEIDEF